MKKILLAFIILLTPLGLQAQEIYNAKPASGITTVALDGAVGLRTFTIATNRRYSHLRIGVIYVKGAGASATTLTVTCTNSIDDGATYLQETSTATAGGVGTVSAYHDTIAVSASSNWAVGYNIQGYDRFRCIVAGTGSTTTHTITIQLSLTAGL